MKPADWKLKTNVKTPINLMVFCSFLMFKIMAND